MGVNGAEAWVQGLQAEGVELVFGYPGGAVLHLYDALADSRIQHVLVRHEQAAVHAASGYARAAGRVGVCLATSGPGATNLVTGIANAYMDSIPLVIFTGQVATDLIGTDAFQEVDITGITLPITKHNYLVKNADDLSGIIQEAFYLARTGRPGPVLIDIPKNVAAAVCSAYRSAEVNLLGYRPTYQGHPSQIRYAARLLNEAHRPVLCAGGGVITAGAHTQLLELAEQAQVPVTTTLMGLGAFPENHPLGLGMLGLHGHPAANLAVTNADLLIAVGMRFDDRVTINLDKFAAGAKIIHIDIDPAEIGKNVTVDVPIVGDVGQVLNVLLPQVTAQQRSTWIETINTWKRERQVCYRSNGGLNPQYLLEELGRLTSGSAIVTADVGQHQMWVAQFYRFTRPRSFVCSGGLGTMGYGLPAAIGVQLAKPEALVINVVGDGGFQMSMAEMGTAMCLGLPLKIFLINNQRLGMVRQLQHFYCKGRYTAVELNGSPDFLQLARAYRAEAVQLRSNAEVIPVLEQVLYNNKLTLIECLVDPCEMVYPMVPLGKGLDEMIEFPGGGEGNE